MPKLALQYAREPRQKACVVSHERSGTHFLMNTLAANFGYIARPWINLDFELGLNFHAPAALRQFFALFQNRPVLNVVKSHHGADFLAELLDELLEQFHVFYIYRDPRDVLLSYWRMIRSFPWDEGPKPASVSEFLRAAPRGGMIRYQKEQVPTTVHRWREHVDGWTDRLPASIRNRIVYVPYEALNLEFGQTVREIARRIEMPPLEPVRPSKTENVIVPGTGQVGSHRDVLSREDLEFIRRIAGSAMERLGIAWEQRPVASRT